MSRLGAVRTRRHLRARTDTLGIAVALFGFLVVAFGLLWDRVPLGHDEAVYAVRARDLDDGWAALSGFYWSDYRAPGLPILLNIMSRVFGHDVTTSRLVVVGLGFAVLVGTAIFARQLGARVAAAIAVGLVAFSQGFSLASAQLLADVPGAAFAILAIVAFTADFDRGELRHSLWLVPALTFAATVARFGAPFMVAAGLLGVVLATPSVWRRDRIVLLAQCAVLAVSLALVSALVVLTEFLSLGGRSPADANRALTDGKNLTPGTGFRDLRRVIDPWAGWPNPMFSKPIAAAFLIGIAAAVIGAARGNVPRRLVAASLIAGTVSCAAITVSVGLVVPNYLALTLPFFAIAAGAGLAWLVGSLLGSVRGSRATALLVQAAFAAVVVAIAVHSFTNTRDAQRAALGSFDRVRSASEIAGDQLGEGCVVLTGTGPQVGYYSGCLIARFRSVAPDVTAEEMLQTSILELEKTAEDDVDCTLLAIVRIDEGKRQPVEEIYGEPGFVGDTIIELGEDGDRPRSIQIFEAGSLIATTPSCR